jgi:hypothetical protein
MRSAELSAGPPASGRDGRPQTAGTPGADPAAQRSCDEGADLGRRVLEREGVQELPAHEHGAVDLGEAGLIAYRRPRFVKTLRHA